MEAQIPPPGEIPALSFAGQDQPSAEGAAQDELKYLPLGDFEIRILRILPGLESEDIQCNLTHVECDSNYRCPYPYRALSYCWGDANDTITILVNKCPVPVTRNLEAALRELRGRGILDIWIDALCINQRDDNERGRQILKMGDIYQNAFETLAWLGQEMEHNKEAFSILKTLGMESPKNEEELLMRTAELSTHRSRDLKGPGWAAVAKFMGRPYWQRTWIIQEVALSQRTNILWGQEAIRIETLYGAIATIRKHKYDYVGFFNGYEDIQGLLNIWIQIARNPKAHKLGIEETLSWSCRSLVSEPRDKIFGLLGLCADGKDLVPHPDYQEPLDFILRKITAKRLVNGSESASSVPCCGFVDVICLGSPMTPRRFNIPSWVVDWVTLWASPSGTAWSSCPSRSLTSRGVSTYEACGKSGASVRLSSDGLTLVCRGYEFDTVWSLCKKHSRIEALNNHGSDIIATRDTEMSIQNNVYGGESGLHEAVWRSLVQDRRLNDKGKFEKAPASFAQHVESIFPDDARKLYVGWSKPMANFICAAGDFEIYGRKVRTWSRMHCETTRQEIPTSRDTMDHTMKEFWDSLQLGRFYRLLMETGKGYVGLAHALSQVGDVIALLQGASVPIILRPCEGGYKVIGEAYVHGIMDGEYWNAQDQASMVEFHLK